MVDSELLLAECVVDVLAERGVTVRFDEFGHLFGSVDADAEWDRLLADWLGPDAITARDLDDLVEPLLGGRQNFLDLKPGVADLFDAAHERGWRTGLGTGQSRRKLERRLQRLGLLQRLDAIVTRAEVERGKPFPDIFLAVASLLEVDPADCLVLEDSLPGVEAALAAGMRVVACPSPVSAHLEFPPEAHRVDTLHGLDVATLFG
jgi:beta-phosphoglucomutase-like phosphatase (HAD superfamily)